MLVVVILHKNNMKENIYIYIYDVYPCKWCGSDGVVAASRQSFTYPDAPRWHVLLVEITRAM